MKRTIPTSRRDRAVVLVLVLWILVVLSLMAYSLLFQVTTETTITSTRKKYLKAEALARAGIARGIIDLRNDMLFDSAEEQKDFDGEGDVWARPEEGKEEMILGDDEDGYFNVRIFDEEGLFNINRMSASSLPMLAQIIETIGYNEEDAELVASAILDWKDNDYRPMQPNAPHTEEGIAYAILRGEDEGGETDPADVEPIVFRNEDFLTVDELLEVYGVTPELYFGPESPEAEYYRKRLGERRQGDRFEIENRRRSRLDDGPPLGLRDYFTIHGSGTLNVNTAPAHVLAVFADVTGIKEGRRFAETVIRERRGGKDRDIDNSDAFQDRSQMLANPDIQSVLSAGGAAYPLGVESNAFRIISEGVVGEVTARMEVISVRYLTVFQRNEDFEFIDRARERRDQNSGRYERRRNDDNELRVQYPFVRIVQAYQE